MSHPEFFKTLKQGCGKVSVRTAGAGEKEDWATPPTPRKGAGAPENPAIPGFATALDPEMSFLPFLEAGVQRAAAPCTPGFGNFFKSSGCLMTQKKTGEERDERKESDFSIALTNRLALAYSY